MEPNAAFALTWAKRDESALFWELNAPELAPEPYEGTSLDFPHDEDEQVAYISWFRRRQHERLLWLVDNDMLAGEALRAATRRLGSAMDIPAEYEGAL